MICLPMEFVSPRRITDLYLLQQLVGSVGWIVWFRRPEHVYFCVLDSEPHFVIFLFHCLQALSIYAEQKTLAVRMGFLDN